MNDPIEGGGAMAKTRGPVPCCGGDTVALAAEIWSSPAFHAARRHKHDKPGDIVWRCGNCRLAFALNAAGDGLVVARRELKP